MTHPGSQFKLDVEQLMAAGKLDLPNLAFAYATLNNKVSQTNQYDSDAFSTCPSASTMNFDQVCGPWSELRATLQNLLGLSAQNFEAAGAAIVGIANTYAGSDAATKTELEDAWKDRSVPPGFGDQTQPQSPPKVAIISGDEP